MLSALNILDDAFSAPFIRRKGRTYILVNAIHAKSGGGLTYLENILPLMAEEPDLEFEVICHPSMRDWFKALSPKLWISRRWVPKGWVAGLLWEQLVLPWIAWRYDLLFSPANFGPLLVRKQVIVLQNVGSV